MEVSPLKHLSKVPGISTLVKSFGYFPIFSAFKSQDHIALKVQRAIMKLLPSTTVGVLGLLDNQPFYDDLEALPEYVKHMPSGTSIKCLLHYKQLMKSKHVFKRFDYGKEKNRLIYGSETVPPYTFSSLNVPVSLFVGKRDNFIHPLDLFKLRDNLLNHGKTVNLRLYQECGHMTFLWGKHVETMFWEIVEDIGSPVNL